MATIHFTAKLCRPASNEVEAWTFIHLPQVVSDKLPTRSMSSIEGSFNGTSFHATLNPDGQGGHWLKVDEQLRTSAKVNPGDLITLEIAPVTVEPEPVVPEDFTHALNSAPLKAFETWRAITAIARRDWIQWITSGKKAETRTKRIDVAIDKLSKGSRRPCCFDRSGMYDKSLSCPIAEEG
ncbi:MAG: YdeI/OmpD-associated family protein [Armatimonadota bacterium]